jgi:hypothetical protein
MWFGFTLSGLKYLYHISASGSCFTSLGFSGHTPSAHVLIPFRRGALTHFNVFHWVHLVFPPPLRQVIKIRNTLLVDAHVWKWNRLFIDPMHSDEVEVTAALDCLHQHVDAVIHMNLEHDFRVLSVRKLHPCIRVMLWVDEFAQHV